MNVHVALATLAAVVLAAATAGQAHAAPAQERAVLITVDDLPITGGVISSDEDRARATDGMLAALAKHGISSVGLVTWKNVRSPRDLDLLRRWLAAGHELGNHSWAHRDYTTTESQVFIDDVERARCDVHLSLGALSQGRDAILARYRAKYSTKAKMGELAFELVEVWLAAGWEVSIFGDAPHASDRQELGDSSGCVHVNVADPSQSGTMHPRTCA